MSPRDSDHPASRFAAFEATYGVRVPYPQHAAHDAGFYTLRAESADGPGADASAAGWRLVARSDVSGMLVEETSVVGADLAPVSAKLEVGTVGARELSVDGGRLRVASTTPQVVGGEALVQELPLAPATYLSRQALLAALTTLPLGRDWSMSVRVLRTRADPNPLRRVLAPAHELVTALMSVVREEEVTVAAGTFRCWVVGVREQDEKDLYDSGTPRWPDRYWVSQTDHVVVRSVERLVRQWPLVQFLGDMHADEDYELELLAVRHPSFTPPPAPALALRLDSYGGEPRTMHRRPPPTDEERNAAVAAALAAYPPVEALRAGAVPAEWTEEVLRRYAEERREYEEDLHAHQRALFAAADARRRTARFELSVGNAGYVAAVDVVVRLHFLPGVELHEIEKEAKPPAPPGPPLALPPGLHGGRRRARFAPPPPAPRPGPGRYARTVRREADGAFVVEYRVPRIARGDWVSLDPFAVVFTDWQQVQELLVRYEVSAPGARTAASRLHYRIQRFVEGNPPAPIAAGEDRGALIDQGPTVESPGAWTPGEPVAGTMVYAASEEKGDRLEKVIEHTLSVAPVVSGQGTGWLVVGRMVHGKVRIGSDEPGEQIVEQRVVLSRDLQPTVWSSEARRAPGREPVNFNAQADGDYFVIQMPGAPPTRAALPRRSILNDYMLRALVPTWPLAQGWEMTTEMLMLGSRRPYFAPVRVGVVGEERITEPAGAFDCWVVALEGLLGGGLFGSGSEIVLRERYWINKAHPQIVVRERRRLEEPRTRLRLDLVAFRAPPPSRGPGVVGDPQPVATDGVVWKRSQCPWPSGFVVMLDLDLQQSAESAAAGGRPERVKKSLPAPSQTASAPEAQERQMTDQLREAPTVEQLRRMPRGSPDWRADDPPRYTEETYRLYDEQRRAYERDLPAYLAATRDYNAWEARTIRLSPMLVNAEPAIARDAMVRFIFPAGLDVHARASAPEPPVAPTLPNPHAIGTEAGRFNHRDFERRDQPGRLRYGFELRSWRDQVRRLPDETTVVTCRAGTLDSQDLYLLDELYVTFPSRDEARSFVVEYEVTSEGREPERGRVEVEVEVPVPAV